LIERINALPEKTLRIQWTMAPDLQKQILLVEGHLSAAHVENVAKGLFPDLLDWVKPHAAWASDLQGVNQLLFLSLLQNTGRF
jgi:hypothetical protein